MVIFKSIPNYSQYFAGSDGEIYSNRLRGFEKKPRGLRKLKPGIQSTGKYFYVNIQNDLGVYKTQRVHRIICSAFHGPAKDNLTVSHLNGNWRDNRPENLKWETYSENLKRKLDHGTDDTGFKNSRASLTKEQLIEIRVLLNKKELTHKQIGAIFGVSRLTITKISNGYRYKGQGL